MKRREVLGVIGGAAAWPLAVWAQQPKNGGACRPLAEAEWWVWLTMSALEGRAELEQRIPK